jgi:hypothetical protein
MGMSKSEWISTALAGIAAVLTALCLYAAYLGLDKTGKGALVSTLIIVSIAGANLLSCIVCVVALVRNLHDAHRAKALRAQISAIKDEHAGQIAKLDSDLCKARADLLGERSRKLGYVKAGALQVLARQADELRLRLLDLCATAMFDLSSVPEELRLPLERTKTPEDQWKWTHRFAWKFQRDFFAHKSAVEFEVIADFTSPVMGMSFPSNVTVDTLIAALDTHHALLLQRSNGLLN